MSNLIDLNDYKIKSVLPILLQDHTILWGTASYESFGSAYAETAEISEEALLALPENTVQPRAFKAQQDQKERTKVYAEVFTPSRICKKMNDYADEELNPSLPEQYIPARILEITCGEAPFLVSRYDADTGELIPVSERIGLLDRKLKLISLKSRKETTWYARVRTAFQSTYGYEFQGDNLLIARINLLLSFIEYLDDRWHRQPAEKELHEIANIISANEAFRKRLDRVINVWEHCDVNQLGVVALQAAYTPEGAEWLDRMNAVVHGNWLELRDRFAEEFPGVRVATLDATYLNWLDFAPLGLRGMQIQDHLLEHEKLWVNAGDIYGSPSCMRINLACPRATLKRGLDLYIQGLHEML